MRRGWARAALPFLLTGLCLAFTSRPARAVDQPYSGFRIDLRQVSHLYDTAYRDRITDVIDVDTTATMDWEHIKFGNQRYQIKTFLPTDWATTREVVDYTVIPGYRTTFTVPRAAFFENTPMDIGDLTIEQPRDYTIPGLGVEIRSIDQVVDEIQRETLSKAWKDVVRQRVMTEPTPGETAQGGIKFNVPLPMPKSLESIFGPGEKTSITIRGREEITIAGETTVTKPFLGVEGRQSQSLFPSLDMQQKLDVTLTGTIGDKVSIQVDHSSEAISDNANRVRLAYNGYEDEIIQLIELGNTNLSLPGSQLVSVSTSAQGLFGVKMLAKAGSTDFTLIASKQEGETSSATFAPAGGGLGQSEESFIRDVDYIKNKYFYFADPRAFIGPRKENSQIEVYRGLLPQEIGQGNKIPQPGWAIVDAGDGKSIGAVADSLKAGKRKHLDNSKQQDFELLTFGTDYDFIIDAKSSQTIGIELFDPIPDNAGKALAVSYINELNAPVGGTYRSYGVANADTLLLKMLKAPDPQPTGALEPVWRLMIRNIYNLGLTNIDQNSLKVEIEDNLNTTRLNSNTPEGSTVKYLKIFGLDKTDRTGTGKSDGLIDLTYGFVDLANGLLQFPSIEAFAPSPDSVTAWTDTTFAFTGKYATQYDKSKKIYTDKLNPQTEQEAHQYIIHVTAVSTSKTFQINALNIVEGSETIKIGSDILSRGTDYDIDYDTGEVNLKEGALAKLTPNSQITIDYQFKPLGGLGSSTLAGVSSVSKIGDNARLGTTMLYESKSTSESRPRLGEEPTRAIVAGITGSYEHQSRLLTDLANLLPYVDTDAPSTVNLDGEVAASFPNPNTKHEAYIEDFEGTEDSDRLSLSRRAWYPASLPFDDNDIIKNPADQLGFIWYNIEPKYGIHRRDLNPELDTKENTLVQTLDLDLDVSPDGSTPAGYAGVMLGFSNGGIDISQGQFLEIWVNDFKPDPSQRGGKLHIDLGIIDENFHNPGSTKFDDEDKNRDGFAATFDDTGLDGLFNTNGSPNEGATSGNPDPSGDDINLNRDAITKRFEKVNGTENNLLYDTEDLDRNGQMTTDNAYFSYEIDLADSADIDIRRQYPGYDGYDNEAESPVDPTLKQPHINDSWRLYRVRLTDNRIVARSGLQPRFDEIRHARIWFDNASAVVRTQDGVGKNRLQLAEISIQGNRWEVDGVRDLSEKIDSTATAEFAIGAISTKTDPGVYKPPVTPNEKNEVSDKESSLALRYKGLEEGQQVRILKRFLGQGQDMTLYRDLNFWVHTNALRDSVEYYFRLGANENNYYEIAVPFTATYYNETGWARVVVRTSDITGLKFGQGTNGVVYGRAVDSADPTRSYPIRMVGLPSLQSIRFLYAGVRNFGNSTPQDGEIWMDDIFSGDVQRNFDHAERLSANVSLGGGAFSVGGNWARTGADYRGLRQKRGSGADNTVLSLNARTDMQYFLPLGGFSIPLAVGYGKSTSLPKFPPNSDTEIVDPALQDSLRTQAVTRSFNTSLSRRTTSKRFLMRYTFDALRPSFSYADNIVTSPAARDTSKTISGALSYQLNWAGDKTLPIFGRNRFRWWPNSFDFSTTATRTTGQSYSYRDTAFTRDPYRYSATVVSQGSVRYNPFRSLETNYGMTLNRDASIPHEWLGVDIGTETSRSNNARVSFVPPRGWYGISIFEPSIEVQSRYAEDSSPNVRRPGDPEGTLNANASRNDTGRLRFDFARHAGRVLKWAGVNVDELQADGRGQQPPPSAPPGTPPDSAQAVPDTTAHVATAKPRPGAGSLLKGIARIFVTVRPISANISHTMSSTYLRIPDRPDITYRLGMDSDAGIDEVSKPDTKKQTLGFNLDSGVQLTRSLDLQGRYRRDTGDTDFRSTGQTRTLDVTWPDLQAKWDGLANFRPMRPILTSGTVNVNYKKTHHEDGPKDQPPVNQNETLTLSPALDMMWKNELQTTLSVAYTNNLNETRGSKAETNSRGITLDMKRNFRGGGGIGFFGKKMNWDNDLEATFSIAYSKSGGERTGVDGFSQPIPASTAWHVSPTARYVFSKNINGSAFIDYNRTYAESTGQTTTQVRLGVTAVVTF